MFSRRRTVSNRWSIRIQLLSLTLAVMMPLVALLVLTKFGDAADEVQNAGHSALNLAEVAASSTEQFLQDSKALLTLLAPRARRYVVDSVTCDSFQHDFSNLTVQYTILEVIDKSGQPLCSTVEPVTANLQAVADRQWFQNLVRDHSFTISEPLMGRITGKWSVVLGYPLEDDDGQIVGAVSVSIDLTRYQFMLDAAALDPGSVITIIDSTGTVIAF